MSLQMQAPPLPPVFPVRQSLALNSFVMEPGTLGLGLGCHQVTYKGLGDQTYTPGQLMVGLAKGLDLRLFANGLQQMRFEDGTRDRGGFEPWLGLHKSCFVDGSFNISVGYWHKFPLPEFSRGMGNERHEDQLLILASRTQGKWLVDFNAIVNYLPRGETGRQLQTGAAFSVTRAMGDKYSLSAGVLRLETLKGYPGVFNSHVSFGWLISPECMVDIGIEHGLNRENKTRAITVGFAYFFGKLDF